MPRKPRFFLPEVPVHIVIRGHSCKVVFAEADDYHAYLDWLKEGAKTYECRIHAYVLMSNHIHWLVSATKPIEIISTCRQKIRALFQSQIWQ